MKVVLCHGTFDFFHYGHLMLLEEGRALAGHNGILAVSVTSDAYVRKGEGRPIFREYERLATLRALRIVSFAELCDHETGIPAIRKWRPNFYLKGQDYKDSKNANFLLEKSFVEECGGEVVIAKSPRFGSTELLARLGTYFKEGTLDPA